MPRNLCRQRPDRRGRVRGNRLVCAPQRPGGRVQKQTEIAEFGQRGTVFGEISSILKKPRTATLVALEPTEVIHINAELDELIAKHPDVARKIIVNLAERLAKTTGDLWTAVEKEDVK
jgi:CRP-like cAMP-binding protein